ncbi:hypothetical protein SGRA_3009 [Saprospira grandis str. Lewin]|uniref:Uncharacterized protein n=1 Tax=Saprospira grandis (strain Lewin) TaxID=984262 RepID=H6KZG1_SAPGL|nr:hypothetical protein SGRA_3009 [Saprospira grandis str. Lewin]
MKQGLLSRCGEQDDGPTRLAAAFRLQVAAVPHGQSQTETV